MNVCCGCLHFIWHDKCDLIHYTIRWNFHLQRMLHLESQCVKCAYACKSGPFIRRENPKPLKCSYEIDALLSVFVEPTLNHGIAVVFQHVAL